MLRKFVVFITKVAAKMCQNNCNCNCDSITIPSIAGPAGVDGLNSFTQTTAQFTVPAINANVTLAVSNTNPYTGLWAQPNQDIFIQSAGYYRVVSSSATSIVVTNLGVSGNAVSGNVISNARYVVPAGYSFPSSGNIIFNYFNATAGTGSWQLFDGSSQDINYTDYALSTNGDEIEITGFIFTGLTLSANTAFRFRLEGTALLTTPNTITYSGVSRVTFEIKLVRVTSTTMIFMAKQYKAEANGQTTVYDWSTIGTITVADLDNQGNYPLSLDFQVNSNVAATLGWQKIKSNKIS